MLKSRTAGVAIIAIAISIIIYGVHRGEILIVLQKATHICLECIGIG